MAQHEMVKVLLVGGLAGTGKSLLEEVSITLGFGKDNYFSAGNFFRDMAKKRGVTNEELGEIALTDPSIDHGIDERTMEIAARPEPFALESRLGPFFVGERPACKILLVCNQEVRIRRIVGRSQFTKLNMSFEDVMALTIKREDVDATRYKQVYGIENFLDPIHYDRVIDTTRLDVEQVRNKMIDHYHMSMR